MHRAERWAWRVSLFCDPSESRPFDPSLPRSRLTVFDADWNILKKKREGSRQRNKLSVVAGQDWVMHDMKWRVCRQEIVARFSFLKDIPAPRHKFFSCFLVAFLFLSL